MLLNSMKIPSMKTSRMIQYNLEASQQFEAEFVEEYVKDCMIVSMSTWTKTILGLIN